MGKAMSRVEYIGPFRDLRQVPKKTHQVYDENIGRNKAVTVNWRVLRETGQIVSQPIDDAMVQIMCRSPLFREYEADKPFNAEKDLVYVALTTGEVDEGLAAKEENARLKAKIAKMEEKAADKEENAGRGNVVVPDNSKTAEREALAPKKKGRRRVTLVN